MFSAAAGRFKRWLSLLPYVAFLSVGVALADTIVQPISSPDQLSNALQSGVGALSIQEHFRLSGANAVLPAVSGSVAIWGNCSTPLPADVVANATAARIPAGFFRDRMCAITVDRPAAPTFAVQPGGFLIVSILLLYWPSANTSLDWLMLAGQGTLAVVNTIVYTDEVTSVPTGGSRRAFLANQIVNATDGSVTILDSAVACPTRAPGPSSTQPLVPPGLITIGPSPNPGLVISGSSLTSVSVTALPPAAAVAGPRLYIHNTTVQGNFFISAPAATASAGCDTTGTCGTFFLDPPLPQIGVSVQIAPDQPPSAFGPTAQQAAFVESMVQVGAPGADELYSLYPPPPVPPPLPPISGGGGGGSGSAAVIAGASAAAAVAALALAALAWLLLRRRRAAASGRSEKRLDELAVSTGPLSLQITSRPRPPGADSLSADWQTHVSIIPFRDTNLHFDDPLDSPRTLLTQWQSHTAAAVLSESVPRSTVDTQAHAHAPERTKTDATTSSLAEMTQLWVQCQAGGGGGAPVGGGAVFGGVPSPLAAIVAQAARIEQVPGFAVLGGFVLIPSLRICVGGQGAVKFAHRQGSEDFYAIKWFSTRRAYENERACYDNPDLQPILPRLVAMGDNADGRWTDPDGRPLAPYIIMEKGVALYDSSKRHAYDVFSCMQIICHIVKVVIDLHAADYVHRDLKPSNVLWLPSQHRWTAMDFGSAAKHGEVCYLSLTLSYAAPEVAMMFERGARAMVVDRAVDIWAVGVMAYELLTNSRVWDKGAQQAEILDALAGRSQLPWEREGPDTEAALARLGLMRAGVMAMLARDPAERARLPDIYEQWTALFLARQQ